MSEYSAYDIEDVPECYAKVLRRIKELFDSEILIYDYDDEWLNFGVETQGDRQAIIAMEAKKAKIFPGSEIFGYQILCPSSVSDNSGLWLHYMPYGPTRQEYRCGCWFY